MDENYYTDAVQIRAATRVGFGAYTKEFYFGLPVQLQAIKGSYIIILSKARLLNYFHMHCMIIFTKFIKQFIITTDKKSAANTHIIAPLSMGWIILIVVIIILIAVTPKLYKKYKKV